MNSVTGSCKLLDTYSIVMAKKISAFVHVVCTWNILQMTCVYSKCSPYIDASLVSSIHKYGFVGW